MMEDIENCKPKVPDESTQPESMDENMFTSDVNLGGGGGIVVQTEESQLSMLKRVRANLKLCTSGFTAGAGMFAESYFLFAIGNIEVLWHQIYPQCFDHDDELCNNQLVSSFTYVEIIGVICGMLTFGYFADLLGRRWGSCTTASLMFVGAVLTTASYAGPGNLTGMFIFFLVSLLVFGYGVGGEYPLASASAAERAEAAKKSGQHASHHVRGKSVVMVFAMQGWGSWVNTSIILLILAASGCTLDSCSDNSMSLTWRLQYGIGALFLLVLMTGRLVFLKESKVWLERHESRKHREQSQIEVRNYMEPSSTNSKPASRALAFKYFWSRIVGTSLGWFVWDIVFYGNKLFQTRIIGVIVPGQSSNPMLILEYTLLNATVALIGYYCAALVVDKSWMGRRRLQNLGFFMTFVLFLVCAIAYDTLIQPQYIHLFQAIYYLSSFFGQFGPNATTWLLPSELFPTEVRTMAHGISAACGKMGALVATLVFTFGNGGEKVSQQTIFYICSFAGLIGLLVTEMFIPDVTTLDLAELDIQWDHIRDDRAKEYSGDAVKPEYLSVFERMALHGDKD